MIFDWWAVFNRLWLMVAVTNLMYNVLPYITVLFPNLKSSVDNDTSRAAPLSSLTHRTFSDELRVQMKEEAKRMFYWGYDNYLNHAFPYDELNPVNCSGRGHDWEDSSNLNVNDALGDYSLTLVDTLDTLVVMGNISEFKRAVQLVTDNVAFDRCTTVQVFEATIRVLGGLLSAHLLIKDPKKLFGDLTPANYEDELLSMAHDLASRLLPAFQNSSTGIPAPRVNLCTGTPVNLVPETCTAGAGTLTIEFSLLSRLLGDPVYENLARRSVRSMWDRRNPRTGLLGNVINIHTGQWTGRMSGLGAGLDSFYEYLLKSFIFFGDREDLQMFKEMYESITKYLRKGRRCRDILGTSGRGPDPPDHTPPPPLYVNVDYGTGRLANHWIDSLSASFSGVQVLAGDLDEAICTHAIHYSIWRKYDFLPERYDWKTTQPSVLFNPLRPELVESTYLLYQATRNPFYLHVGSDILKSLERHAKTKCGYATIHNVVDKSLEDRMESFFLSETSKYLYLLFDKDNIVNREASRFLFTTEGHLLRVDSRLHRKPWEEEEGGGCSRCFADDSQRALVKANETSLANLCSTYDSSRQHSLPLSRELLGEIETMVGL